MTGLHDLLRSQTAVRVDNFNQEGTARFGRVAHMLGQERLADPGLSFRPSLLPLCGAHLRSFRMLHFGTFANGLQSFGGTPERGGSVSKTPRNATTVIPLLASFTPELRHNRASQKS